MEFSEIENFEGTYDSLLHVFNAALLRASIGKGKERHATDEPFEDQPICTELRLLGTTPAVYQVRKKARETLRMSSDQARREWLDVIVHAAAAFLVLNEELEKENDDE